MSPTSSRPFLALLQWIFLSALQFEAGPDLMHTETKHAAVPYVVHVERRVGWRLRILILYNIFQKSVLYLYIS